MAPNRAEGVRDGVERTDSSLERGDTLRAYLLASSAIVALLCVDISLVVNRAL